MCRMIAVLAEEEIKSEWLEPFELLAVKGEIRSDMTESGHHDGWGLSAYFHDDSPKYLFREPHSITQDSEHFRKCAQYLEKARSKTVLAHLRKTSVGHLAISNTHPFLYKEWSFSHNGTIYEHEKIPLQKLRPAGTTDSERFFLFLMERIEHINLQNEDHLFAELKKSIEIIKEDLQYSSLTFLLTNGKSLFVLRDCDEKYQAYYTLYQTKIGKDTIVCSEPLEGTAFEWGLIENGSFLNVKRGAV